jgi:hypothetical protein
MGKVTMMVGRTKGQAAFVSEQPDCAPGTFEILSKGSKGKKADDIDWYYVIKLKNGQVSIVSSGVLRGIHEAGTPVFEGTPEDGKEGTLLPNLLIGVKNHKWIVAAA